MIDRAGIEKDSVFVGRDSGFQMEFDMHDAEGRKNGIKYPDTSYFRKDGSFGYKAFGITWSVICLLAEIAVVVILTLVG